MSIDEIIYDERFYKPEKLVEYAKCELSKLEVRNREKKESMDKKILEIVEKFGAQEHGESSTSYVIFVLSRLLRFKPLVPLTGENDEWREIPGSGIYQNKRCSSVFKELDGRVIDIDAVIVSDNGGIEWYTDPAFAKEITFPYEVPTDPEKVYIEWVKDNVMEFEDTDDDKDNYEVITDDPKRIEALHERKLKEYVYWPPESLKGEDHDIT